MTKINREAGDKTKGFTLQKQRAIALFFDEVKSNPNTHVNVAIEYKGDVYLQNDQSGYIEEQKNYNEEKAFSFNSNQILNTLAYFLEIWLAEGKSQNTKFGFYSTTKIAQENSTRKTKFLNITFPSDGLLKKVVDKNLTENSTIENVRKILVQEYIEQYNEDIEDKLENDSLLVFLNSINWYFEQDNEKDYKQEVIKKIKESKFANSFTNSYQADFVYASLMLALEEKQDETDRILKFLRKDSVENFFLKVAAGQEINLNAHKYLSIDISDLKDKIQLWFKSFLERKYFSNVKGKSFPVMIERKVAKHNREIKIERTNLEQTNPEKAKSLDVIIKELGGLINDVRPTFLFGEIGSGKSTLLAHYFLKESYTDSLPIFIPSTYLKGKISTDFFKLKSLINDFVNEELNLADKSFDLDAFLLTKKKITLIIDGVDEFDQIEARKLLTHLLKLAGGIVNLKVIASGRPIELQELVNFNQWNCLTTLDLTEKEIKLILKNEAVASGKKEREANKDALQRWQILKSKQELLSNATTPLTVCLIRDFLDENLNSKTLGDILYEVIKRRLNWHDNDQKESFTTFLKTYPHTLQREKFIAPIAYKLYLAKNGKINEDTLFEIINSDDLIPNNSLNRNVLVNEAINFFKSNFLQKIGENYVFQSHQLHQLAIGLHLFYCIKNKEEFIFKDDKINSWREISYSASVARIKGESEAIKQYLEKVMNELLFLNDNTPATSILLAEAQISILNLKFLNKLKTLGFRPLKFWGQSDSLVPNAYAYILKDIGDVGFNWFFDAYLNPKHPSRNGQDEMAALILQYYFIRSNFELSKNEKDKIRSIIHFHLKAKTFSCHTLLPTIVLAIPNDFEIKERCILLTDALKKNITHYKAEELLRKELEKGELEAVINSLEIACRNKNYQPEKALKLWLELIKGNIPKLILDNCIVLIAKGNKDLFVSLEERTTKERLIAYCRFNVIYHSTISDSAAIILYEHYDEKNILLVGEPILKKSEWFDYKNLQRENILNEIIHNTEKGEEFIIRNTPHFNERSGVSVLYLKYFLASLLKSKNLYINDFLNVIKHLNKYSLARYPEIREGFIKLLSNNDEYYNELKESVNHLDIHLRYNSAAILLICNPENEKEALEIIIRSTSKKLNDNQEFLRLCMKLKYSTKMLDFMHDLLCDLTAISRIFVLKLLYHNNEYKLNKQLFDELIKGLIGDASFLDWSGNLLDDGIERVIGKEKSYDFVLDSLNSDKLKIKQSAASSLLSYYTNKLDNKQKAYCWLLYVQYFNHALIDFHNRFQELFEDSGFVQELKDKAREIENIYDLKELMFLKYYEALKENGNWKDFFLALLKTGRHLDHHKIEDLYGFIIDLGNSNDDIKERMGKSIKDLMAYPVFSQNHSYNFLIPQLAVLAHEFDELSEIEIKNILINYRISQEEITCALLYRLGNIPKEFYTERGNIEHISIFSSNRVKPFDQVNIDELNITLEDGEDIPNNLIPIIEATLLQGGLTDQELLEISKKGNLAKYFSIVISFSRDFKIDLKKIIKAEEIGSFKISARDTTQKHKSILSKIKNILIINDNNRESYIEALINEINDNKESYDLIDLFYELFALNADFEEDLLVLLFNALIEVPYKLNLNLVYWINEYVLNLDNRRKENLVEPLKIILKAVNNSKDDRHENGIELMSWSLSLILIYITKKTDKETDRGFLIGLKNAFMQKIGGKSYNTKSNENYSFYGRDVFFCSNNILGMIENKIIQDIIKKGISTNIPELSSICKILSSFSEKN